MLQLQPPMAATSAFSAAAVSCCWCCCQCPAAAASLPLLLLWSAALLLLLWSCSCILLLMQLLHLMLLLLQPLMLLLALHQQIRHIVLLLPTHRVQTSISHNVYQSKAGTLIPVLHSAGLVHRSMSKTCLNATRKKKMSSFQRLATHAASAYPPHCRLQPSADLIVAKYSSGPCHLPVSTKRVFTQRPASCALLFIMVST